MQTSMAFASSSLACFSASHRSAPLSLGLHMRREIIQILACDNYDVVKTSAFYFQENSFLIFFKII
jgi:hypothetical protein